MDKTYLKFICNYFAVINFTRYHRFAVRFGLGAVLFPCNFSLTSGSF